MGVINVAILESKYERVKLLKKGFSGAQIEALYVILNSFDVVNVDWQDNEIPYRKKEKKSIDIKDFLEDCRSRGLTKQTMATYKSNIATFLKFVGNPLNVDTSILCKFLEYLKEMEYRRGKVTKKGVHPNTIKAYFSSISTYYDYLVFNRQLNINPVLQFTRHYLSTIKDQYNCESSRQIISIDDMRRLLTLDMLILDRAILIILAKTGVRRGELIAMDREDLNLEKKEIILKPKAKRTNRLVFFDDETALVLGTYLEWRDKKTKSKALFVSSYNSERISRNRVNEIVAKHGSTLGLHDPEGNLNTKLTPHCFRHWFNAHLKRSGLDREFIQELKGDQHKDAIDIYDHIDLSELKNRYLECIPKLFNAIPM
jgi:integrase/recombinase XerD